MSNKLHIRQATKEDCSQILQFVKELADYEKLSHEVVATPELLAETLFGDTAYAHCLIAEYEGVPVSFALYFFNYSTFLGRPGLYLEDVYTQPDYRGKGIGKALLSELAKIAKQLRCGRMEWSVLDWNQPSIDFYKSLGAEPMDEWTVYRLTGEKLDALAASGDKK